MSFISVAETAKSIENIVRTYLLARRLHAPNDYLVPTLEMFEEVVSHTDLGIVTTGFFNRVVADMKKTGVLKTAHGGEFLLLTDEALAFHQKKASGAAEGK